MPNCPEIISAVTRQNHDVPMPMASPVTMLGSAPDNTTSRRIAPRPAPRLRAEATRRGSTASAPCTVLSRMGKSAPVKVMNTIDSSDDGNIRIASGIQATAGIGRSTSSGGNRVSSAHVERPINSPSATPNTAAAR